jgi:tetratricopeptide (TPR) repeat protein
MKKFGFFFLLLSLFSFSQENPDDLALADDAFENHFYEALKHKATENYDLAIAELNKCLSKQPENEVVLYEMGRNYFLSKNFLEAKTYLDKVLAKNDNNRWYLDALMETEKKLGNTNNVLSLLKKLSVINSEYKEEIVDLYMITKQYDEALVLIEELNKTVGKRATRTQLKERILMLPQYQQQATQNAQANLNNDPKDESNYTLLIKNHLDKNEIDKAFEVAKTLEQNLPNSPWAKVTLFKLYLDKKQTAEALDALKVVMDNAAIDKRIKHRMINELLSFSNTNPEVIQPLKNIVVNFNDDQNVAVLKEIGKYYQGKKNWSLANEFYDLYEKKNPEDLENLLLLNESFYQLKSWDLLSKKADLLIQSFPLQPQFYWYKSVALLNLNEAKNALKAAEEGLEYVVENPVLEKQFYQLLSQIADKQGDLKKKELYLKKTN